MGFTCMHDVILIVYNLYFYAPVSYIRIGSLHVCIAS